MVGASSILFLSAFLGATVLASQHEAPEGRVLRAATKMSNVFRRNMRIEKKFGAEMSYVETENGWATTEVFASQLRVGSFSPVLNLEDIEHHLDDVQCGKDTIKLRFVDVSSARDAMHACDEGLIITSHEGCNVEGERAVYKVNNIKLPDDEFSLELSVIQRQWKEAFNIFDIDFGYTSDSHLYRKHSDFNKIRKRQQAPSSPVSLIPVPTDAPKDVTSITFDLTSELVDKVFAPGDFAGVSLIDISFIPTVGCKRCTTSGSLVLTQGAISINISDADIVPDVFEGEDDGRSLFSVITGGFFELTGKDISAHVELFAIPKRSGTFEIPLPPIPLTPFTIPGVGMAGAEYAPTIQINFEVTEGGIEINYGFDASLPSESKIRVDLTNLPGSKIIGIPDAKLEPLPFTTNATNVDILLGVAFRPAIPIGFKFLNQLEATVQVFMDLPRLDAKLTTRKDVDTSCNKLPSIELPGNLANIGPLTLLELNASVVIGVGANFEFPGIPAPLNEIATDATIFSTAIPLATSCLAAAKGYQPATNLWDAKATPTTNYSISTTTIYVDPPATPQSSAFYPVPGNITTALISSTNIYRPLPSTSQVYPVPGNTTTATVTGTVGYIPLPTTPIEFPGAAAGLYMPVSYDSWQLAVLMVTTIAGVMILL